MCIVFLHHHPSSGSVSLCPEAGGGQCACPYLLVLAVNRDEFFERATKPLGFWGKGDIILGGEVVWGLLGRWGEGTPHGEKVGGIASVGDIAGFGGIASVRDISGFGGIADIAGFGGISSVGGIASVGSVGGHCKVT